MLNLPFAFTSTAIGAVRRVHFHEALAPNKKDTLLGVKWVLAEKMGGYSVLNIFSVAPSDLRKNCCARDFGSPQSLSRLCGCVGGPPSVVLIRAHSVSTK